MTKTILILSAFMLSVFSVDAQETTWAFDNAHSSIQFSVSHMVISELTGNFHEYEGTVKANKPDFSDATINLSIMVGSIDTDNEKRDEHLRAADFFDTEKYPTMTFQSKAMEKKGENKYNLIGDLALHGVTKEVILNVKYGGTVTDPYGNVKAGFKITGEIDRTDFGLKYNSVMDSGGLTIGEEVGIICNVELIKTK